MRLDFHVSGSWQAANSSLSSQLGLEGLKSEAKVYRGLHHALLEITQGLVKNFPTKKKIFCFKGQDPYLDGPLTELAKQGLPVLRLDLQKMSQPEQWLEQIDREALMVLYADDDPLLGRLFPTQALNEALADQRVFRVHISHANHFFRTSPHYVDRYEVKIMAVDSDSAVAVMGDKARVADLVAAGLYWPKESYLGLETKLSGQVPNQAAIEKFEQTLAGDFKPVFEKGSPRVFDRAAVYWTDLDGYAFIDALANRLGFELGPPGSENRLETPSLSRWGGVRTMDWLVQHGLDVNVIRGTVLVSAELVDENLPEHFSAVRQEILRRQEGS